MKRQQPALEDVAEEEDMFAAEMSSTSAQEPGSSQVAEEEEEGQLSVSQIKAEFVQLTFRKQVSYSPSHQAGMHGETQGNHARREDIRKYDLRDMRRPFL